MPKIIAHLDLDAFFASVEERDKPRLAGKPIVVGADPEGGKGRGVVATANYKAREYGIHSAMPISHAWQLSENARRQGKPPAIFMSGNYAKYSQVSQKIMDIIRKFSPQVEQASVDEAYFNLTQEGSFEKAKTICQNLKKDIQVKQGLSASIGLGPNKLIAKIASDMQKPNGLTIVKDGEAATFLAPLSLRKIPGVGPKTEALFNKMGWKYVRDLQKLKKDELMDILGKLGEDIYYKVHGLDDSLIVEDYEAKSIGEQETFRQDVRNPQILFDALKVMSQHIAVSLKKDGFKNFRAVVITVRFGDFETKTRMRTIKSSESSAGKIYSEGMKLLMSFLDKRENPKNKAIRLIGVRVEKLTK